MKTPEFISKYRNILFTFLILFFISFSISGYFFNKSEQNIFNNLKNKISSVTLNDKKIKITKLAVFENYKNKDNFSEIPREHSGISLFEKRRYNSDIADGLISKIISNSILKNSFLKIFKNTEALNQIENFQNLIDTNKNATNLIKKAESFLKKDPLKYIELMSEIRVQKLDFGPQ